MIKPKELKSTLSHDGIPLTYMHNEIHPDKKWIVFILPFGLHVNVADAFFSSFEDNYNIVTWEARTILAEADQTFEQKDLSVDNHVADLLTILDTLSIHKSILVGYCSGAGVALAAASNHSDRFSDLILVNGEYVQLKDAGCSTQYGRDIDSLLPIASSGEKAAQFILERMNNNTQSSLPPGFHIPFSKAHFLYRYAVNYVAYRTVDFAALARTIEHKTLLITGGKDKQANVNSSLKIQKLIDNAQIFIDSEGDHYEVVRPESSTLAKISLYLSEL
ncbi:MAG: alpha/beta hydrolase [Gammaproteobacteria bacterium]|nr:alpha/beta hydrolase [Gammaproteobacteria bacterium]MBU2056885.1 alpha/beta hydrolase [Gammaproteobacteria bacterium]MBU2174583.1 alpha/beta hydrolase [Gammaproteobacteria bacterium]MBU2248275.1 alpha/beta hydrolase [Gammaproteobacteria bacterium]MBU2343720.1 alpha/beta hydrolase [Gammaproteobacteria bacterium]